MNFIVVGIRFWGREWCKLLKKQSVASVVATVDLSEAAAKWSRETLGIPCFSSLEEAAAKTRADAVLVVTNPGQHKPVILEALRLKKHVLVEKPMVTSVLEADEIAAAAEHSGVNVMAAQGYRFLRAASFIRDRLAAGDIGELQGVKIRFQPEPSILDNRKTLAVVFGSIESVQQKREIWL